MNAAALIARSDTESFASSYRGKRVVVTGALGFLGTAVVGALGAIDCVVVRVARRAAPAPAMTATVVDVEGDVRDAATWTRALAGADHVFHLAAQTSAATADADPGADFESNVRPVEHLVAACRAMARKPAVVFAGSVTQGEDGARPQSAYDTHKLAAEALLAASRAHGLRAVTLRLSNLYGPGPAGAAADRGVLNRMLRRALRGEAITVFARGEFTRDYLHVDDAARAFLAAGASMERLGASHYVVGCGRGHTVAQAFELVAARAGARIGRHVPVVYVDPTVPLTPLQMRSFVADPSAFTAATGWRARLTLAAGIDAALEELACASS